MEQNVKIIHVSRETTTINLYKINQMTEKEKKQKLKALKDTVRNIPDFPIPGIQFKDVTPLFKTKESLRDLSEVLVEEYKIKA